MRIGRFSPGTIHTSEQWVIYANESNGTVDGGRFKSVGVDGRIENWGGWFERRSTGGTGRNLTGLVVLTFTLLGRAGLLHARA